MGKSGSLDKSAPTIRGMFAEVAPRYDLLNHLLSAGQDIIWRRKAAAALALPAGSRALDLCCGTGDQALDLARRGLKVTAADFCLPMLTLAEKKYRRLDGAAPHGLAGDGQRLPFPDCSFDGVSVSFGLRNVARLEQTLGEMHRVLRPGGRAAILEFSTPRVQPLRGAYLLYFHRVLPAVARLASPRGSAYNYLAESVDEFPQRRAFGDRMGAVGFESVAWRDLSWGIVCLYEGSKAT